LNTGDISIKRKDVRHQGVFSEPVDFVNSKHVLNSASYVGSYRAALKWYYELNKVVVPSDILKALGRYTSGFKRVKNQRKQDGEEDADEGKQPMQFSGYEWLALRGVQATGDYSQAVFAWVFLLFAWNLISRGRNIGKLMFEHLSWQDDALTVRMYVKKQDQEGKDCKAKHVFANPIKPWICPILALAVYIFTQGPLQPGSKMLIFGNESAEDRFSKWLRGVLGLFEEPLHAMGIMISTIGTHSFRKGTATWLAGMVDGPTGIQIYLRAGWSLGMQKRYIHEGGGCDRHVGRAATGLTLDSEEFGCLPPHFDVRDGAPALSNEEWEIILPGFLLYPESFRVALPFLLASLLYHWDYIIANFAGSHPIRSSRLFTLSASRIAELKAQVHTGTFKNPITGMVAKGVPQQVRILHRIDCLERQYLEQTSALVKRVDEIPEQLTQCMLDRFQVNGAQPLLETRVSDMINDATNKLRDVLLTEIRLVRGVANEVQQSHPQATEPQAWQRGELVDGWMQWTWGGRIHPVPEGWCLPRGNVSMLFNLWVNGNPAKHLRPYRFLKGWDLQAPSEDTAGVTVPLVLTIAARKKALVTMTGTWRSYLMQATDVMIVIQNECQMSFQDLQALSAQQ